MKTERRLISAPPDWWEAFTKAATRSGSSLSEWIRDAAAARLTQSARQRLSEPKTVGRPRIEPTQGDRT